MPMPAGPHTRALPIQLQTLPAEHSALSTHGVPGGNMPPGSHTFVPEQASPMRQGIVPEQVDPTEPPGGMTTSPAASPGSPPSFDDPPAPPPPPAPLPPAPTPPGPASKSRLPVTALELLHASAPPERTTSHVPLTARK